MGNPSLQTSETGDDRLNEAQRELGVRLAFYRDRDPTLTRRTIRDMEGIVRDFRDTCKRRGLDFPKLRIVAFLRMNHILVWPEELSHEEIQKRLKLFIIHRQRHDLPIHADDMAKAVRRAYPEYSPSRFNLVCSAPKTAH